MDKTKYMAVIESINEQAIKIMRADKKFAAHCFLLLNVEEGLPTEILMAPINPKLGGNDVRQLVAHYRPQGVVTAMETWAGPDKGQGRPEALVTAAEHVEHGDFISVNVITRLGKKLSVENNFNQYRDLAQYELVETYGRFTGLLGKAPSNHKPQNIKRIPGYRKHFKQTGFTIH